MAKLMLTLQLACFIQHFASEAISSGTSSVVLKPRAVLHCVPIARRTRSHKTTYAMHNSFSAGQ